MIPNKHSIVLCARLDTLIVVIQREKKIKGNNNN